MIKRLLYLNYYYSSTTIIKRNQNKKKIYSINIYSIIIEYYYDYEYYYEYLTRKIFVAYEERVSKYLITRL